MLSGAAAHAGTSVNGRLGIGDGSVTGDGRATVHVTHVDDGHFDGVLTSANVQRSCTVTVDNKTAQVAFEWNGRGGGALEYPYDFIPDEGDDVFFRPMLDEEDDDSAIDGHSMQFEPTIVVVRYWSFDWATMQFSFSEPDEIVLPHEEDMEIADGVYASDLVEMMTVVETAPGEYRSVHTVHDYWEFGDDCDFGIEVLEYKFRVFDLGSFKNQ